MKRRYTLILALFLAALMMLAVAPSALATLGPDPGRCPHPYSATHGGHEWSVVSTELPTCQHGYIHHYRCLGCGATTTEEEGAPLNHRFDKEEGTQPTCTQPGMVYMVCSMCGTRLPDGRPIPALGHNFVDKSTPGTCTQPGETYRECTRCGAKEVTGSTPALGHAWGEWKVTQPGTCIQQARETHTCSRCGATEWKPGDYGDHDWGEWITVQEPTTTSPGLEQRVCKNTPNHVETRDIPALEPTGEPALELNVWDVHPLKEVYAHDGGISENAEQVRYRYAIKNTGTIPLFATYYVYNLGETKEYDIGLLQPGETYEMPSYAWFRVTTAGMVPDAADSPYAGTFYGLSMANGYEVLPDGTKGEIICESNDWSFEAKIAKPADGTTGTTGDPTGDPTGGEKPALEVTLTDASSPKKSIYDLGDPIYFTETITNVGNVDLELYDWSDELSNGNAGSGQASSRTLLKPGESTSHIGSSVLSTSLFLAESYLAPGSGTETLEGVFWSKDTYPGYKPGTDEVLCTGTGYIEYLVGKKGDGTTGDPTGGKEPHPGMSVVITWAADEGVGKRYLGAPITLYLTATNTGDCPITTWDWDHIQEDILNPTDSVTYIIDWTVDSTEVDEGVCHVSHSNTWDWHYRYQDKDGEWQNDYGTSNPVEIPLTYPGGETPEEKKPGLEIIDKGDDFGKEIYDPDDYDYLNYTVINTGDLKLKLVQHRIVEGVEEYDYNRGTQDPGDSNSFFTGTVVGGMKQYVAPSSGTEDLMGVVRLSVYVVGLDPETDKELCRTETLTRNWKVGKEEPTGWKIPDVSESDITLTYYIAPGYESSDTAGYQLGEDWIVRLTWTNTGKVDLSDVSIHRHDPFDGYSDDWNNPPFDVGDSQTAYYWNTGTITEADVAQGYIYLPATVFSWTDPETGESKSVASNDLTLNVISKTGLLLEKSLGKEPDNHLFFQVDEEIQWKLTVTNTSKETVKNVVVVDQGVVVGSFAEIKPGETVECAVPNYKVTELDVVGPGYVTNMASATGEDLKGVEQTWISNVIIVPCGTITPPYPPVPPVIPPVTPPDPPEKGTETPEKTVTIKKDEAHAPANGEYYQLGEPVDFVITVKNNTDDPIDNLEIFDSLESIFAPPIGTQTSLAPGEEATFNYQFIIIQENVDDGYLVNVALLQYTDKSLGSRFVVSDPVKVDVGKKGGTNDDVTPPPFEPLEGDTCELRLDALGSNEIHYTLHACNEHLAAAQAAEAAAASGTAEGWRQAGNIWRAEVDKQYEKLFEAASSEAKAAIINDRAMFYAYLGTYEAVRANEPVKAQKAIAEMLRQWCAELCCVVHTAPEQLPSSVLNGYGHLGGTGKADTCEKEIGALIGSDSEVTERFDDIHAQTLAEAMKVISTTDSYHKDEAFVRAQRIWQMALDSQVNAVYKAADKGARKAIAAWRMQLDQLVSARGAMLNLIYADAPEVPAEMLATLYRDAAIDACGNK